MTETAPPFATSLHVIGCLHCKFVATARSPLAALANIQDHVEAAHPHGGTQ